jgi:hypothetical protein
MLSWLGGSGLRIDISLYHLKLVENRAKAAGFDSGYAG